MPTWNKLNEYQAGQLTLPAVVMLEELPGRRHLAWVAIASGQVVGPISCVGWDADREASVIRSANVPVDVPGVELVIDGEVFSDAD